MGKPITDRVTWVGKIDWELKRFHGDEYSTDHGSSYNSYLIRDGKTILLDTVWQPFEAEYIQALKDEVDLAELDAIICQHAEIDHSGALAELVRERPDIPIYCTANGVKIIKGMFHGDWNFQVVKTGDMIELDSGTLTFVEAPMLHWPDTMFTYYSADEILFPMTASGSTMPLSSVIMTKLTRLSFTGKPVNITQIFLHLSALRLPVKSTRFWQ